MRLHKDYNGPVNVIALVKESERYIFLYDEESSPALLQTLGRFAGNPDLSFSWYDAAVLSQKVRRLKREAYEEALARRNREEIVKQKRAEGLAEIQALLDERNPKNFDY